MKAKRSRNQVPDAEHRAALVAALHQIDPSWSGKFLKLPKPIDLRRADGSNPMDEVLARRRESALDGRNPRNRRECLELEKEFCRYLEFKKRYEAVMAAAQVAYGSAKAARDWWLRPNVDLGGDTPENLILSLAGTERIAEHLRHVAFRTRKPITTERMGSAAIRIFIKLAKELALDPAEQVGILRVPEATYASWRETALAEQPLALDDAILERISHVLGIYKELASLFHGSHGEWLRRPNTNQIFGGRPPIDLMLADPEGLAAVHTHLDCFYGGWA